jgi:hypothetical protein
MDIVSALCKHDMHTFLQRCMSTIFGFRVQSLSAHWL